MVPGRDDPVQRAVGALKAPLPRPLARSRTDVPLTCMQRRVARITHHFGQQFHPGRKSGVGPALTVGEVVAAGPNAAQQRRPRRGALRHHIVIVEFHAFTRETVQIGRRDTAAVIGDIPPPQVVGDDEQNIWRARRLHRRCRGRCQQLRRENRAKKIQQRKTRKLDHGNGGTKNYNSTCSERMT